MCFSPKCQPEGNSTNILLEVQFRTCLSVMNKSLVMSQPRCLSMLSVFLSLPLVSPPLSDWSWARLHSPSHLALFLTCIQSPHQRLYKNFPAVFVSYCGSKPQPLNTLCVFILLCYFLVLWVNPAHDTRCLLLVLSSKPFPLRPDSLRYSCLVLLLSELWSPLDYL